MKTKVIYKERDANGVQVAIKEIIYNGSTWATESGTLTVYSYRYRRPIASFPHGDWLHAEDPDNENNSKP